MRSHTGTPMPQAGKTATGRNMSIWKACQESFFEGARSWGPGFCSTPFNTFLRKQLRTFVKPHARSGALHNVVVWWCFSRRRQRHFVVRGVGFLVVARSSDFFGWHVQWVSSIHGSLIWLAYFTCTGFLHVSSIWDFFYLARIFLKVSASDGHSDRQIDRWSARNLGFQASEIGGYSLRIDIFCWSLHILHVPSCPQFTSSIRFEAWLYLPS